MEEAVRQKLATALREKVFPGAVVGISKNGKRTFIVAGDYTYENESLRVNEETVYDLASVTKSVATSSVLLKLIDEGRLSLEDKVSTILPEFNEDPSKKDVTIWHLLTYTVELDLPGTTVFAHLSPDDILAKILTARLLSLEKRYHYTNSTAIILGLVAERITGSPLDMLAQDYFYTPLGMDSTSFHPKDISKVAPTEVDPKRGGLLQGVVHDEGAYALSKKQTTGAAGLFGSAPDLLTFTEMLLAKGRYRGKNYFSETMVNEMHTNQLAHINQCAGLGWEMGMQWMGSHSHPPVFGKSGFTGTSVMADPETQTALVILSNRVYPKRPADSSAVSRVRAEVGDIVFN